MSLNRDTSFTVLSTVYLTWGCFFVISYADMTKENTTSSSEVNLPIPNLKQGSCDIFQGIKSEEEMFVSGDNCNFKAWPDAAVSHVLLSAQGTKNITWLKRGGGAKNNIYIFNKASDNNKLTSSISPGWTRRQGHIFHCHQHTLTLWMALLHCWWNLFIAMNEWKWMEVINQRLTSTQWKLRLTHPG